MAHQTLWNAGEKETLEHFKIPRGEVLLVVSIHYNGPRLYRVYIKRTKTNQVYFMYGSKKDTAIKAYNLFRRALLE